MVGVFLGIAGAIYGLLGALHAVYTLADLRSPRRIVPDDPAVITAMQTSKIRLTRGESTVWQGWIGFNLSHSLGALMFSAACFIVAACLRRFAFSPGANGARRHQRAAPAAGWYYSHPYPRHRPRLPVWAPPHDICCKPP
jgi:hypothetical protein